MPSYSVSPGSFTGLLIPPSPKHCKLLLSTDLLCVFQASAMLATFMHCLPHAHFAAVQVRNKQPSLAHIGVLCWRRPHVTASAGHALARKLHT